MNLKIGSWDINDIKLNDVDFITNLLTDEDLDVLTIQQVSFDLINRIQKELGNVYSITSQYKRCLNPINNLRIKHDIIISKLDPVEESHIKKIPNSKLTFQMLKPALFVYTTHSINTKEQLNSILNSFKELEMVSAISVLTGSINLEYSDPNMQYFIEKLKQFRLKVVDNNCFDYMIVPNSWNVEESKVLDINLVNTHNPIITKVKRK